MANKKPISFRGSLNGEMLEELLGTSEQRDIHEKFWIEQLSNPKVSDKAKELIIIKYKQQIDLVNDANKKQITMSYMKLAKTIAVLLSLFLMGVFVYLIIHNAMGTLDLNNDSTKAMVSIIGILGMFWLGMVVSIFKKGGDVEIKAPKVTGVK